MKKTGKTALITGASSGIGQELARIHAAAGDEVVIIARREKELIQLKEELESSYGTTVTVIVKDLSRNESPDEIFHTTEKSGIHVDYLINNAGFGGHGYFHERDWKNDHAMIMVNMHALTRLSKLYIPGMIDRKYGKILNVSSTAAFLPGPLQGIYYATKSYVLSLSQAMDEELREHNISVTALCPGPVATEFAKTASVEETSLFKNASSPREIAEAGYNAMMKGKLVKNTEPLFRFAFRFVLPFMSRRAILKISRKTMEKSN